MAHERKRRDIARMAKKIRYPFRQLDLSAMVVAPEKGELVTGKVALERVARSLKNTPRKSSFDPLNSDLACPTAFQPNDAAILFREFQVLGRKIDSCHRQVKFDLETPGTDFPTYRRASPEFETVPQAQPSRELSPPAAPVLSPGYEAMADSATRPILLFHRDRHSPKNSALPRRTSAPANPVRLVSDRPR